MKLAEPITNSGGITLMPAGIRLTPMFIARIKKWGIEFLDVIPDKKKENVAAAEPAPTTVRPRTAETIAADQEDFARAVVREISGPFVSVRDNETMMLLRASVLKRLIQHGRHGIVNVLRRYPAESDEPPAEER
ncbi:MAG: hypothetical protein LIQ30_02345 [Planctomycetes bacterium]|nr:hypothetical protein [Planctomycetota bacterium]